LRDGFFRTGGFTSELYKRFRPVKDEYVSPELRKEFEHENVFGEKTTDVNMLFPSELPEGTFIKSGYFLIDDVKYYLERNLWDPHDYDIFYDTMSPEVYAAKLKNEIALGKREYLVDDDGEEIRLPSCGDYMYFSYPDYCSEEYEAEVLRQMVMPYNFTLPDGCEIVILEIHG
jgi:hypothetical protein